MFCFCFHYSDAAELSREFSNPSIGNIYSPTECYKVIKKLGQGAFGRVYAVEDSYGKLFALKCYKNTCPVNCSMLADSKREFQIGQLLDHPNIIKSFDLFTPSVSKKRVKMCLLLELIEGKALSKIKKGFLSREEAINAAIELVRALRYAFSSHGVMHLDLHEGNIMLDQNFNLKVIDLASFFTLDDLIAYNKLASKSKSENSNLEPANCSGTDGLEEPLFGPVREAKLKRFIVENRELFNQKNENNRRSVSSEIFMKNGVSDDFSIHQQNVLGYEYSIKTSDEESFLTEGSSIESFSEESFPEVYALPSYAYYSYFNSIAYICEKLVMNSSLAREEQINLRAEILKQGWNYRIDLDEGIEGSLESYLDRLLILLLLQVSQLEIAAI